MGVLTKDKILAASDLKTERVNVPEWSGEVIVSEMTAAAQSEWADRAFDENQKAILGTWTANLVAACLVDEKGRRLFSFNDVDQLASMGAKALSQVYKVALRLNGLGEEAAGKTEKN